ncbi:hypothetical protein FKM82_002588 [Ascaphus truei]
MNHNKEFHLRWYKQVQNRPRFSKTVNLTLFRAELFIPLLRKERPGRGRAGGLWVPVQGSAVKGAPAPGWPPSDTGRGKGAVDLPERCYSC